MRVLVISVNGAEVELGAVTNTLAYLATPYTVYNATATPGGLTPSFFSDAPCHGKYQAVVETIGDVLEHSTLQSAEVAALHAYESQFHVRQVVWYSFPVADFGLVWTGATAGGWNSATDSLTSFTATLTPAGALVFPYLNLGPKTTTVGKKTVTVGAPAAPLPIEAYTYLAQPLDAFTTPLVTDTAGNTIAATATLPDGREQLTMTFDSNQNLLHNLLFGYGVVNWATRGMFVGERHVYMSPQVDDVLIDDDQWVDGTSCALVGIDRDDSAVQTIRMSAADLGAVALWQAQKNLQPTTAALRLTMAFNGWGATAYKKDTLTPAVKLLNPLFYWVSHTYDHPILDGMSYADAKAEFTMNDTVATKTLKLKTFNAVNLVTPNISGLTDPNAMQAAYDAGVRYVVTDTSIPGYDNPYPNIGIYNPLQPAILMIPRRPVNLFYNVASPSDWASEYNCIYQSYFGRDLSYAEIIDFVSDQLLPYLLHGENDPWMFHQPNLVAYDKVHTLLTDLMDATIAKYNGYFTLPVVSPTMDQLGALVAKRMAFLAAQVTATINPGVSVTITSDSAVSVPLTGVKVAGAEVYGGQTIVWVKVPAGGRVTIPLS